jgi:PAS domain S-box-containing protein
MNDTKSPRWYSVASTLHNAYTAWLVLLLSLVVTVGAYVVSDQIIKQRLTDRFAFRAEELEKEIKNHLLVYEQVLRSTVAMMYASEHVTRKEFAVYVRNLGLDKYWPGIQGIGYAVPIPLDELPQHVAQIRAEGFPDYTVRPAGERSLYSAIVFLEPFDWRNRRAFGYDMYSNDMRREAMDRARRTGESATSGKIILVQETDQNMQSGFLTYLPVYKNFSTPETERARIENFSGWIYAPFRVGDLMKGVTGGKSFLLEFEIYDGDEVKPDALLYSSNGSIAGSRVNSEQGRQFEYGLSLEKQIELHGRPWTLRFSPSPGFVASMEHYDLPQFVAIGGVFIDLLLFYVILSLHFIKQKAESIAEDRTHQLQLTQADLQIQKTFANAVIDSLPLVIYVKERASGKVVRWNQHAKAMFGIEPGIDNALFERFSNRIEYQIRLSGTDQAVAYLSQLDAETELGIRWFNVSQTSIDSVIGEPEYTLCSAIDVTDRLDSEKRFTTLFDSAPCGLMLVSSEQAILLANRTLCGIFGYDSGELINMPISTLVPEELRAMHQVNVAKYAEHPTSRKMSSRSNLQGVTKSGRRVFLDIALQPLPYDEQQNVLVSITDITEHYQLVSQLETANRYKSEFLASMSHELRTPLNAVIGFTERVVKGAGEQLSERHRDALSTVQRNANNLLSLINDILDLSKIEAGRMELDLEWIDVRQLVDMQLQMLAPSAKAKGLLFRVDLPTTPLMMSMDKSKLIQILNNLVSNAVKYTEQGRVDVSLALDEGKRELVLKVKDTGLGIPKVDLDKLFNEFVRVKEPRVQSIQGTGLGLAICSRLVTLLGGHIFAESEYNVGSMFTVILPLNGLQD